MIVISVLSTRVDRHLGLANIDSCTKKLSTECPLRHTASRIAVLIAFLSGAVLIAQVPIRYIYDELGRLSTVVDANGDQPTTTMPRAT
jgi:hypothetical protein